MTAAQLPIDEPARLAAVRRYDILDTPPDGAFDRLTSLASRFFDVPIAIVSIVDSDRIWFKSHHGVETEEIGREPGLCASAILHGTSPWVVENAAIDARTLTNPLVAGDMGLRFYAGIPLTTQDGYNLGTFCILDQKPREISDEEIQVLRDLAQVVMEHLELRLSARQTVEREASLRSEAQNVARSLQQALLPPEIPQVPQADVAVRWEPALAGQVGGDFYDVFESDGGRWNIAMGDVCGKGLEAAVVTALARYTLRAAALQSDVPCQVLGLLNDALLRQRPDDERFVTAVYASVVRTGTGISVSACSAGHVPLMVRRADGEVAVLMSSSMPLGLFADLTLADHDVDLLPGDALVLYTDGVTEARQGGTEFGLERLEAVLSTTARMDAEDTASTVAAAVASFREGAPADDTAVLVLTCLAPASREAQP